MSRLANTPAPPYYLVVFTSQRSNDIAGYDDMAVRMFELAHEQPGFLGVESAHSDIGITVSYWRDLESLRNWKANTQHRAAQQLGRERWYEAYRVRVAKVERDYGMDRGG